MIEVFRISTPYSETDWLLRPGDTINTLFTLLANCRPDDEAHAVVVITRSFEPDDFWEQIRNANEPEHENINLYAADEPEDDDG